jgi:hypothetical protein
MSDIWSLVWGKPEVDPRALADAVERAAYAGGLDFRTRLLIRDATAALAAHWGEDRLRAWLERSPARRRIEAIRQEELGAAGFPSLRGRLMERLEPETIRQYLRELGTQIPRPVRLHIGGAAALILGGYLARSTEDIDIVDEVPAELRAQRALLDRLQGVYGLHLAHFQSHFLPSGWETRLHTLEPFGALQAATVDVYDVFLGKLFSKREKDRDDLRLLLPALERDTLTRRLATTCAGLLGEASLRQNAEHNWYILTGQPLPAAQGDARS